MPEWIHNRAEHLLAKNPDMSKSQAFAIATQQSHALGKSPKGYGTAQGKRIAKRKFDTPKDDVKSANPGGLDSPKLASKVRVGKEKAASTSPTDKWDDALHYRGKDDVRGHMDTKYASMRAELLKGAHLEKDAGAFTHLVLPTAAGAAVGALADKEHRLRGAAVGGGLGLAGGYGAANAGRYQRALEEAIGMPMSKAKGFFSLPDEVRGGYYNKADALARKMPLFKTSAMSTDHLFGGKAPKYASMREKLADIIPGGKADGKTDKDFDKQQLRMGRKVEREHTNDPAKANEIARDHLQEIPDYYTRLKKMEDAAPKREEERHSGLSKKAMDPDDPYLLDQVGKPKVRQLSPFPPNKALQQVKAAAATGVFGLPMARDPQANMLTQNAEQQAKQLAKSQKIGTVPQIKPPKLTTLAGVKTAALGYHGLRTAIGAGTGAALGAAAGAIHGGQPDEQGQTHRLRGALLGGAAGTAVGGAVGYAAPKYLKARQGTMVGTKLGPGVAGPQRYAVAPMSRMDAARSVFQTAQHDVGSAAQSAGESIRQTGQNLRTGAERTTGQGTARGTRMTRLVTPGQFSADVPTDLRQEIAEIPQWGHGVYGHQKAASAKYAWSESMYSGGTSIMGGMPLNYSSYIPPFNNPPVKTAGPPPEQKRKKADIVKVSAMLDELAKLNAVATTPGGRLAQSRKVGQPKTTPAPGPTISQIAKPVGYGTPEPGTTKTARPKAVA